MSRISHWFTNEPEQIVEGDDPSAPASQTAVFDDDIADYSDTDGPDWPFIHGDLPGPSQVAQAFNPEFHETETFAEAFKGGKGGGKVFKGKSRIHILPPCQRFNPAYADLLEEHRKGKFCDKGKFYKGKVFFKGSGKGWNYIPSLDDELDEIHGKGWKGKGKGPKGKVNIGFLCVSDDDDDDDDWKGKGKGPKGKVYILSLDDELDEIHGKGWKGKGKGPKGKVNIAALPDDDDELDEGHGKGWKGKGK